MSYFKCLLRLLVLAALALAGGCGPQAPAPGRIVVTQDEPPVKGQIELSNPKVFFVEPNVVQFEVAYKFTEGKPDKYYQCDITFPGTGNVAVKPMEKWELKPEGVIKDKATLTQPGATTFSMQMSETVSPQLGYTKISNVLTCDIHKQ